jgi:hypothetical protein
MKIKMTSQRAGVDFTLKPGDVIDVSDEEGKRLIELGKAEPVREQRQTASRSKREKR